MPDDIDATGWLVILSALALGFGVVRFVIVTMREESGDAAPGRPPDEAPPP